MADFKPAFSNTLGFEGGYSDHPADKGGETYRGVARTYFPNWKGWTIIDRLKRSSRFPGNLKGHAGLNAAVRQFYLDYFWNPIKGNEIKDQAVAMELFDTAVNMGTRRGVRFLQQALNLLNRNQKNYQDLIADGYCGPKTLGTLQTLLRKDRSNKNLLKMMNIIQGCHYTRIMENHPDQEVFARGWMKRVEIEIA